MQSDRNSSETQPLQKKDNPITHHGARLKHARLRKGYTLKQLAERVECSESMISKLENSRLSPSLAMLHRLARELDTSVPDLLISADAGDDHHDVIVFPKDRFAGFQEREPNSEIQVWWDRILPLDKTGLLQVSLQHLSPGAEQDRFLAHEGEEFVYVLEGVLDVVFEERTYTISSGELIYFPSTRAHRYRNTSDQITRSLWIGTPPVM